MELTGHAETEDIAAFFPESRIIACPFSNRIAEFQPEIAAWRHDFHAHPELLFDVHRTAGIVAEKLKSFGCDEVVTGIGGTGVVAVINGRGAGSRMIGLRADMDALPMTEKDGIAACLNPCRSDARVRS